MTAPVEDRDVLELVEWLSGAQRERGPTPTRRPNPPRANQQSPARPRTFASYTPALYRKWVLAKADGYGLPRLWAGTTPAQQGPRQRLIADRGDSLWLTPAQEERHAAKEAARTTGRSGCRKCGTVHQTWATDACESALTEKHTAKLQARPARDRVMPEPDYGPRPGADSGTSRPHSEDRGRAVTIKDQRA